MAVVVVCTQCNYSKCLLH